jgi:hypothetical protein
MIDSMKNSRRALSSREARVPPQAQGRPVDGADQPAARRVEARLPPAAH